MISIQDLKDNKPDESKPYQKAICVNIIHCTGKTYYRNAKQENKVMYHMALADQTSSLKATCYNEDYYAQTKEGYGMLIRNYLLKNDTLIITKQSKISRMPPIEIPAEIIQEAINILQPPAPPVSPIKTVREVSVKTLLSVSGTIIEEEQTKNIFVGGQETQLKSITVKDTTDSVKITLWREAADFPIVIGQYIHLSHVTVHEFNKEKILNTTRHTKIQVIKPPEENLDVTIYGLDKLHHETSMVTVQVNGTEDFQSMEINNTTLMDFLHISYDVDNLADTLMKYLPLYVKITFCNGSITNIIENI